MAHNILLWGPSAIPGYFLLRGTGLFGIDNLIKDPCSYSLTKHSINIKSPKERPLLALLIHLHFLIIWIPLWESTTTYHIHQASTTIIYIYTYTYSNTYRYSTTRPIWCNNLLDCCVKFPLTHPCLSHWDKVLFDLNNYIFGFYPKSNICNCVIWQFSMSLTI